MIKTPSIYVVLTIDNKPRTVRLDQKRESWSIYDIVMDNEIQGQVRKAGKNWSVSTDPNSLIQKENYQAIEDAINNFIDNRVNPDSWEDADVIE